MKSSHNQTILITGGTSYTARFLIEKLLLHTEAKLVLTSRCSTQIPFQNQERISCREGDLNDLATFQKVFQEYCITHVIHLAAMARLGACEIDPAEAIKINLQGTLGLVQIAQEYQVKTFVFTSSDLARDAKSVVGMCKYLIENELCKTPFASTKFITVRMPNILDSPGTVSLIFKNQIQHDHPVTITDAKMSRRLISGTQAADMILIAMKTGQNCDMFVSTEQAINITNLALQLMQDLAKKVSIEYIGAKPGERLSEPGYSSDETIATALPGFGKLKHPDFQPEETTRMIEYLKQLTLVRQDKSIINFLNSLHLVKK